MEISQSPVSGIIFVITIALSAYSLYQRRDLLEKLSFRPYEAAHYHKWYTIITSGFIHLDLRHLMFNMMSFYFFAFRLEEIVGPFNFFIIYMGGLILSDIPTFVKHKDNPSYLSLGASGAISSVLFAYIIFDPMSKILIFPLPIGIPAFIFAILYLTWEYMAGRQSYDNVNHSAHLWGAIAGIIITALLMPDAIKELLSNFR